MHSDEIIYDLFLLPSRLYLRQKYERKLYIDLQVSK